MDKLFKLNWFGAPENPNTPNYANDNHIFSLVALIIIVLTLSVLIYIAIKRQKVDSAPSGVITLVESVIIGSDTFASDIHQNRFNKMNPYLISLFVFFLFGNLVSLIGFVPIGSSLSVIFAATAITWLGTIGIGIAYNKIKYVMKLLNPLEIASNVSPLISLTFRMFGNIIGGTVLITLTTMLVQAMWAKMIGVPADSAAATINPFGILVLPSFSLYFDVFDDTIQAFVFMILTISYWFQASEVDIKEKHKKKIKQWKKQVIKNKLQEKEEDAMPKEMAAA